MPIHTTCPRCQARVKAPSRAAGRRLECPNCAAYVPVPRPPEEALNVELVTAAPAPLPLAEPGPGEDDGPRRPGSFRCPYCRARGAPREQTQIATVGWIAFAVTFGVMFLAGPFFCFVPWMAIPFSFLWLAITERSRTCWDCGSRVG